MANLPATLSEEMQFAELLSKSTMIPREYQRAPANCLLAIRWGGELGMGTIQALNSIAVINGKPAVYGDALMALVRGSPLCHDIIERITGSGDEMTAICEAKRKGASMVVGTFSVADARRAGLWDKAGPWKQYPRRMLQMRARAFALRDAFPDVLRGISSAEEVADIPREPRDITPQSTAGASDALDAFVAEDTPAPEPATQQPLEVPTEAEIARSQDLLEAVLGPEEVATLDIDVLLAVARTKSLFGYERFRAWYSDEISDGQRLALRPHIRGLREAARKADEPAPSELE